LDRLLKFTATVRAWADVVGLLLLPFALIAWAIVLWRRLRK